MNLGSHESLIRQAGETAKRPTDISGADVEAFLLAVIEGRELGETIYPPEAYKDRDNAEMGFEEARDAGNYALWDFDQAAGELERGGVDEDDMREAMTWDMRALVLAIQMAYCFKMAQAYRRRAR